MQKQASGLTLAHARAIDYFWSHRQNEFAREDTQDAVSHYEETFYHQCQLGRYGDAAATVFACNEFLRRRGYYQLLVDFYSQLHTNWQPTLMQRRDYATACNNFGNAYQSLGRYQQAINYHQQSLKIRREIDDRNGEATSLGNLGLAYYSLKQYQWAIDYHQQSLEIKREIGDRSGEANSLWNLSNIYQQQGKIRKAREYKIAAVRIWQSLKLPIDVILTPEISKRMFRVLEQQGEDWADSLIQFQEQLGWLMDILDGVEFLILLPVRLFQRFKTSLMLGFLVGVAIALAIWWLRR